VELYFYQGPLFNICRQRYPKESPGAVYVSKQHNIEEIIQQIWKPEYNFTVTVNCKHCMKFQY